MALNGEWLSGIIAKRCYEYLSKEHHYQVWERILHIHRNHQKVTPNSYFYSQTKICNLYKCTDMNPRFISIYLESVMNGDVNREYALFTSVQNWMNETLCEWLF